LAAAEPGKSYLVRSVYERDPRLLEFLDGRGVRPGARIRLLDRNYDQTLTLATERGDVPLGSAAAEKVWVSSDRPGRASPD
jgi:DtxR family Mn-dependent transcriptional regulator